MSKLRLSSRLAVLPCFVGQPVNFHPDLIYMKQQWSKETNKASPLIDKSKKQHNDWHFK